jgi:spore germination cell wall hydrolase CwlJ-like protein
VSLIASNAMAQDEETHTVPPILVEESNINNSKDLKYLTLTIWAEARSEGEKGMYQVGSVIINRFRDGFHDLSSNRSIYHVVTEPGQFTVWKKNSAPYKKMMNVENLSQQSADYKAYLKAQEIAKDLLENGPVTKAKSFTAKVKAKYLGGKTRYTKYNVFW